MKTVWDDLFDENMLAAINAKLRAAQRVSDRQAFGMIREARTKEFLELMRSARADVDDIIQRVESLNRYKKG